MLIHKRNSERIPVKLPLRLPLSNTFVPGTVTDLSDNGMFINSELCFPLESKFEVLVKLKNEILSIPVQIARIVMSNDKNKGMGVRILNYPPKFLEFLIKKSLCSN